MNLKDNNCSDTEVIVIKLSYMRNSQTSLNVAFHPEPSFCQDITTYLLFSQWGGSTHKWLTT